ncbi:MAG: hypothetical protein ACWA49_03050 [Ruegeria sp.]
MDNAVISSDLTFLLGWVNARVVLNKRPDGEQIGPDVTESMVLGRRSKNLKDNGP